MRALDEEIARSLRKSEESGELRQAKSYGKPLEAAQAYAQTPEEFRMGFKILKDAGYVPEEVELMRRLAAMKLRYAKMDAASADALKLFAEMADLQMRISMRLEHLGQRREL